MNSKIRGWLDKSSWTVEQSALLLYGLDPATWDGGSFDKSCKLNAEAINEFTIEGIQTMTHILRCMLRDEFGSDFSCMVEKDKVAKWAFATYRNFHFEPWVIEYLFDETNNISDGIENFDDDYITLAKKDLWNEQEILGAIAFCPAALNSIISVSGFNMVTEWGTVTPSLYPQNPIREEASYLFTLAKEAERFKIYGNAWQTYLFKPKEIIEWCEEKQIKLPPMLLSYMGLTPETPKNTSSKLNQNQLSKQLCQAVAKTLWDIYPRMTIEEMKSHHAIQTHGNGVMYGGKNTLRGWLSEVDPRPSEMKTGKKKKG